MFNSIRNLINNSIILNRNYTMDIEDFFIGKIGSRELKIFCFQMYSTISSGIGIYESLEIVAKNKRKNFKKAIYKVRRSISMGNNLSNSFAVSGVFTDFFVNMIFAGENSGNVEEVFLELSRYYDRDHRLRKKTIESLIYPAILFIVGFVAFNFILIFVIPNFEEILSMGSPSGPLSGDFNEEACVLNTWIFRLSRTLRDNFIVFYFGISAFVVFCILFLKKNNNIRFMMEKSLFKIPVLKDLYTSYVVERFSRSLYMLEKGGVRIEDAVEISSKVVNNRYFKIKMKPIVKNIVNGKSISESFMVSKIFPEMYLSMIEVGEESGRLNNALDRINIYYSQLVDDSMETFVRLIEPVMIVIFGILIGFIVVSVISPMYDMMSILEM